MDMRFEDGVTYYRKAIAADPGLDSARSQLGINLMRMGQQDEASQLLETCYNDGYRDGPQSIACVCSIASRRIL